MRDQLVSFETAKLLKELGFNWPTLTVFATNDTEFGIKENDIIMYFPPESFYGYDLNHLILDAEGYLNNRDQIACPTQSLAQKWLRDMHNIHIHVEAYWDNEELANIKEAKPEYAYFVALHDLEEDGPILDYLQSYEEALEEAILDSLKYIKEQNESTNI